MGKKLLAMALIGIFLLIIGLAIGQKNTVGLVLMGIGILMAGLSFLIVRIKRVVRI